MYADIERCHNPSRGVANRNGEGAQPVLQLLINNGIPFALHHPENLPKLFRADHCSFREFLERSALENVVDLLGQQVRQEHAPHGGTKCRQPAADAKIN